ncbi:MAG TPA: type I-MYXAN CRISPR-associated protein Cas6/Cmx6, partial [Gammaproteobacteria bacterium]|nr:type I-MYXAN CRISPR-associated protein Cas6/Cmx6 [Gammaproteobacteria bacterium]
MFWQEDEKKPEITTSDKVVDLSYRIECKQIPGCHAWALSQAMYEALPWIKEDESIGIHQIHGATS